jgi:hypothetical protein
MLPGVPNLVFHSRKKLFLFTNVSGTDTATKGGNWCPLQMSISGKASLIIIDGDANNGEIPGTYKNARISSWAQNSIPYLPTLEDSKIPRSDNSETLINILRQTETLCRGFKTYQGRINHLKLFQFTRYPHFSIFSERGGKDLDFFSWHNNPFFRIFNPSQSKVLSTSMQLESKIEGLIMMLAPLGSKGDWLFREKHLIFCTAAQNNGAPRTSHAHKAPLKKGNSMVQGVCMGILLSKTLAFYKPILARSEFSDRT